MSTGLTAPQNRVDRRKQRTRQALVDAAQQLLAEGKSHSSIQEITDAADVGFGSFYNHFESKDQLFEVALAQALQSYVDLRDAVVVGLDDPAEIFTVSFRMTGRLQRENPELVRVLLNTGTKALVHEAGLAPRARHDIAAAKEAGRFDVENDELALMAAGGAMLGLLQLLESHPEADAASLTDEMAYSVLRMFGMTKREATRLRNRPLPPHPEV
ncbi:TetR family transcriptional regulator [Nocardioides guangzhouensis]|uniref:TetR family transcriptional regulator n=1 Tax=Nocardioides guangzhouensis TaxID=2497878 RepID=A0A4Q4ZAY9_9ACTN|nr:TetR/AcrR family transcriptional regulator [Nocardioides guangzhouensis]RYP85073.1 TetR family transcriptional regulator [Nocardioides guangzhouensis]